MLRKRAHSKILLIKIYLHKFCSLLERHFEAVKEKFSIKIFLNLINFLVLLVGVLVNIAFFTLMERKILGLSQARKGPNKVRLLGLLQPIADAVKLFTKQNFQPFKGILLMFNLAPVSAFFLTALM